MIIKNIHFQDLTLREYPFNLPSFQHLRTLDLNQPITIFVGDNGSGKSTLLKAIAYYNNSINVSKEKLESDYYNNSKRFSEKMKIQYSVKTRNGFFFSGEEFITYINNLKQMKTELLVDETELLEEYKNKSEYVRNLALGPVRNQLYELRTKYDGELNTKSHGEGFLDFFKARMHSKGIYILDEPETPLSAMNQYQLLVLITDLVKNGSQVIIATHSPILMALKGAKIYHFSNETIEEIQYDDIESVVFTKHFLNNKDNFLDRL
ncbi:MAG: AAA family ATPase [Bacilli bacterium]|nr:AAA family ATPase [Bacilli bacterium]